MKALALASCFLLAPIAEATVEPGSWVDTTMASLSLEQKAAQLVHVRAFAQPRHPENPELVTLRELVSELGVGGVVLFASELDTIPGLVDELQALAPIPLLFSADVERGLSFRVERGSLTLPSAMAVAATGSVADATFLGEVTARESLAVGIPWLLAPVADVNNNPANPVINTRSFGEDPVQVGELVAAFVRGAQGLGALATAKHFPGHGDTVVDSHFGQPVLPFDRTRLDAVELVPFRAAIAAGVESVMLGHLVIPSLDPTNAPASLSGPITTQLLRRDLGFSGLIATDSLGMDGAEAAWGGAIAVQALAAGADVLLLPSDARVAVRAIVDAVAAGTISVETLDTAVRRTLELKGRLGLLARLPVDRDAMRRAVARPEDAERVLAITRAAVTVVTNRAATLPIAAERDPRILHVTLADRLGDRRLATALVAGLEARCADLRRRLVGPEVAPETIEELVALAAGRTHIVVSALTRVSDDADLPALHPSQRRLLERLAELPIPLVVVALESPYLLAELGDLPDAGVATYSPDTSSQRAVVEALFGEIPTTGRLPVTLPGLAARGDGLAIPRRNLDLVPTAPEAAGFTTAGLAKADQLVHDAVAVGAFPGAVVAVGRRGALVHHAAYGNLTYNPDAAPVTLETRYDLASLTKVLATTTMAMILFEEGRLDLDTPIASYLPGFVGPGKERVTVRHLLTHSSGIDWWAPLYEQFDDRRAAVAHIERLPLVAEPGTKTLYSDLGVLLLGEILERVAGTDLESFVRARVFGPLRMDATGYRPDREGLASVAPTEVDTTWRHQLVHGGVHDENAAALGGVAPHAGLFGTAGDLARFAQMMLNGGVLDHRRIVSRSTVELFTGRANVVEGSSRALGWDTKSTTGSSAGSLFSPTSFGHTGFTGTSVWIDPERDLFVVLLTNRVHPTRENIQIRGVRSALADAVVEALVPEPVQVGLDRVAAGHVAQLAAPTEGRKRLGLLVHAASVTVDGRHAVEVLRERGFEIARIFTPEHGFSSSAAAGAAVGDGVEAGSGVPIVSLYGTKHAPAAEDLADLDALVIDLQDAGVRFYTYASTMLLALEAAAAQGLPVIVLDRPNPLGGELVAGPVAATREVVSASLVNRAPGPLVHGLTLGEMAQFAATKLDPAPKLTVVPMLGWRREMSWSDTGRTWVAPSPNLRSASAALLYPGTCLLEATNLSEGRGTTTPFEVVGAPWIDATFAPSVAGVRFDPATFTPTANPGAPQPKHEGATCHGWRLAVDEAAAFDPYRLGVALLVRAREDGEFAWRTPTALTWLLGTPTLGADLEAGLSVDAIVGRDLPDHERWREERRGALLYR